MSSAVIDLLRQRRAAAQAAFEAKARRPGRVLAREKLIEATTALLQAEVDDWRRRHRKSRKVRAARSAATKDLFATGE